MIELTTLLKYVWIGVIVPAFLYLHKKLIKHEEKTTASLDEVYNKVETIAQIDYKIAPILVEQQASRESRAENTAAVKDLTEIITEFRIDMAARKATDRTRKHD